MKGRSEGAQQILPKGSCVLMPLTKRLRPFEKRVPYFIFGRKLEPFGGGFS